MVYLYYIETIGVVSMYGGQKEQKGHKEEKRAYGVWWIAIFLTFDVRKNCWNYSGPSKTENERIELLIYSKDKLQVTYEPYRSILSVGLH